MQWYVCFDAAAGVLSGVISVSDNAVLLAVCAAGAAFQEGKMGTWVLG
jgi:hypothetical protein